MPIPPNITAQHVTGAAAYLNINGVPARNGARSYQVQTPHGNFPVKLVIAHANVFANGELLDMSPDNFNSVAAKKTLVRLRFQVVRLR